jgi:hypothetical protein
MQRRRLIGVFERTLLGAAMGAALFLLERRLNRKQIQESGSYLTCRVE